MRLPIAAVALLIILGSFGGAFGIRFVIDREECFSHKVEYGNTVHFSFVVIKSEGSWHYSEDGVDLVVNLFFSSLILLILGLFAIRGKSTFRLFCLLFYLKIHDENQLSELWFLLFIWIHFNIFSCQKEGCNLVKSLLGVDLWMLINPFLSTLLSFMNYDQKKLLTLNWYVWLANFLIAPCAMFCFLFQPHCVSFKIKSS